MNKRLLLLSIILCALSSESLVAAGRKKAPTPAPGQPKPAPAPKPAPQPKPGPKPAGPTAEERRLQREIDNLQAEINRLQAAGGGGGAAGMTAGELLKEIRRLRAVIKDIINAGDVSASGVTNQSVFDVVVGPV